MTEKKDITKNIRLPIKFINSEAKYIIYELSDILYYNVAAA